MNLKMIPCFICVFLLLPAGLYAQRQYVFTTIDFPASGAVSQSALAINDNGQISGGFEISADPVLHAYVYGPDSGFREINISPTGGSPLGINNSGQLSGFYGASDLRGTHAFVYNLHFRTLKRIDVPGSNLTEGTGLNDYGDVVGDYQDATGGAFHGFLHKLATRGNGGTFSTFDFPGSTLTSVSDINNLSEMVGIYDLNNNPGGDRHGFLLRGDGQFQTIEIRLPGAQLTNPTGINDRGVIVGLYADNGGNHGFVLENGQFSIVDVPGAILTEIRGTNNAGVIVGRYIDSSFVHHGFMGVPNEVRGK